MALTSSIFTSLDARSVPKAGVRFSGSCACSLTHSLFRKPRSTFREHALASQINFDHPVVRRHLIDRALGEHRAFMQAGDLDTQFAHESHIVFDDDDGAVAVDLLQK